MAFYSYSAANVAALSTNGSMIDQFIDILSRCKQRSDCCCLDFADFDDPVYKARREIEDLQSILPDIAGKVIASDMFELHLYALWRNSICAWSEYCSV